MTWVNFNNSPYRTTSHFINAKLDRNLRSPGNAAPVKSESLDNRGSPNDTFEYERRAGLGDITEQQKIGALAAKSEKFLAAMADFFSYRASPIAKQYDLAGKAYVANGVSRDDVNRIIAEELPQLASRYNEIMTLHDNAQNAAAQARLYKTEMARNFTVKQYHRDFYERVAPLLAEAESTLAPEHKKLIGLSGVVEVTVIIGLFVVLIAAVIAAGVVAYALGKEAIAKWLGPSPNEELSGYMNTIDNSTLPVAVKEKLKTIAAVDAAQSIDAYIKEKRGGWMSTLGWLAAIAAGLYAFKLIVLDTGLLSGIFGVGTRAVGHKLSGESRFRKLQLEGLEEDVLTKREARLGMFSGERKAKSAEAQVPQAQEVRREEDPPRLLGSRVARPIGGPP